MAHQLRSPGTDSTSRPGGRSCLLESTYDLQLQPAQDSPAEQEFGERSPALSLLPTSSLLWGLTSWPEPEAKCKEAS